MDLSKELSQQWFTIKEFMASKKYSSAVKESGTLLEDVLRALILQYARQLPFKQRSSLNKLEEDLGKGTKGIESFELGPLIQILMSKDVNFSNAVSHILRKDTQILKTINWGYLKDLRNRYVHNVGDATRAEAQCFVSSLEIILSFFDIDILDYSSLLNELDNLKKENKLLKAEKGFIEEFHGLVPFYERYAEIASEMDYRDTCYFAEHDPFYLSIPKMKQIYENVHFRKSSVNKTRIVINLSNRHPIPWLLLYRFVHDYELVKLGKTEYRGFYCYSGADTFILLAHLVLLYNAKDIDNGYVLLSLFDNERERTQKNMVVQNKRLFEFYSSAYGEMFKTSEIIDMKKLKGIYIDIYGVPLKAIDVEKNVRSYFSAIPESESDIDSAVRVWTSMFNL